MVDFLLPDFASFDQAHIVTVQEAVRWAEQSRTSPMQLHPYYRMQDGSRSQQHGRSSAPNLAAFTVAAAAAGMVTALLFETQASES